MSTLQIFDSIRTHLNLPAVAPCDFYRTVFAEGELQKTGEQIPGLFNGVIKVGKKYLYLHDELDILPLSPNVKGAMTNCLTYCGIGNSDKLAMELHGFIVKVAFPEYLSFISFKRFAHRHTNRLRGEPTTKICPTFVTTYGKENEVLFYYVLDKPVPMFNKHLKKLESIQNYLAREIHNGLRSICHDSNGAIPRQSGLFARFPVVGTIDRGHPVEAYKTGEMYTLAEINKLVPKASRLSYKPGKLSLEDAKKMWPTWARKVFDEKRDMSGKKAPKPNYGLFNWYVDTVTQNKEVAKPGVFEGLVAFAVKSHMLSYELYGMMTKFESMFRDSFSKEELKKGVDEAIEIYEKNPRYMKYRTREYLEERVGFSLKNEEKRKPAPKGTQKEHLDKLHQEQKMEAAVVAWRKEHPNGTKAACARELDITWPTVHRWWESTAEPEPMKAVKANPSEEKHAKSKDIICEEEGCGGTIVKSGTQKWYNHQNGNHYSRAVWACSSCGVIHHLGKARITN